MEPELPTRAWRQAATSFHMNNSCMHVWSQESYWSILLLLWSIEATSSYSSRFSHAITLWTHYIAWQWVFFQYEVSLFSNKTSSLYKRFNEVLQKEQNCCCDSAASQAVQSRESPRTATKLKKNHYSNSFVCAENKIQIPACHFSSSNISTIER
jgi:hypothetical protein